MSTPLTSVFPASVWLGIVAGVPEFPGVALAEAGPVEAPLVDFADLDLGSKALSVFGRDSSAAFSGVTMMSDLSSFPRSASAGANALAQVCPRRRQEQEEFEDLPIPQRSRAIYITCAVNRNGLLDFARYRIRVEGHFRVGAERAAHLRETIQTAATGGIRKREERAITRTNTNGLSAGARLTRRASGLFNWLVGFGAIGRKRLFLKIARLRLPEQGINNTRRARRLIRALGIVARNHFATATGPAASFGL